MIADARAEATVPVRDLERAADFYGNVLGLRAGVSLLPRTDVVYDLVGGGSLLLYEWGGARRPSVTVAHFVVDDVAATVRELRARGVLFDDYDMPELKTVDGVATVGDRRFAWFRSASGTDRP
jgi:catechol 2,3-dioxygenase-like lactoylglutathione lyase family enzyme